MQKILKKQGLISSVITFILLGGTFLIVGAQIKILGVENYGVIVLLLSIFSTINLINMGVGPALVSYYTKGNSQNIFWNLYFWVFIILFIIAFIIVIIGSLFYGYIFEILSLDNQHFDIYVYFGASLIGISRLLSTIIAIYWFATVNFLMLKIFNFLSFNLPLISIIIIFLQTKDLNQAIFLSGIINIIAVVVTFLCILYLKGKVAKYSPETKEAKRLVLTGLEFQGISIMSSLSRPIINMLINNQFGLTYTAYFDIAMRLILAAQQILVSATEPFFSVITSLQNKKKSRYIYLLIKKYTFYITMLAIIFVISMYFLSEFVLYYWLGEEFSQNSTVLVQIISIGATFNIAVSVILNSLKSFRRGRFHVFIRELISFSILILLYFIEFDNINTFLIIYSISNIISGIYLYFAFQFIYRIKNNKTNNEKNI